MEGDDLASQHSQQELQEVALGATEAVALRLPCSQPVDQAPRLCGARRGEAGANGQDGFVVVKHRRAQRRDQRRTKPVIDRLIVVTGQHDMVH